METGNGMYWGKLTIFYFKDIHGTEKSKINYEACVEKLELVY